MNKNRIEELNKKIDYNNLKYIILSSDKEFAFDQLDNPMALLNDVKTGKLSLEETKNLQQDYEEYLKKI